MSRILIVDDSRIARTRLRKLLEAQRAECEITEVDSARAALDCVEEGWDAVFCDLLLPDSQGFSVVVGLRKRAKDTPIVVYSANSMADVKEMAEALGCAGYLEKPARAAAVTDILAGL